MLATDNGNTSDDLTVWAVDSGATHHMCNDRRLFLQLWNTEINVRLGDTTRIKVTQQGIAVIHSTQLCALFIPEFRISLLSVSQLDQCGFNTQFANSTCIISRDDQILLEAPINNGLYKFNTIIPEALATTRSMTRNARNIITKPRSNILDIAPSSTQAGNLNFEVNPTQAPTEASVKQISPSEPEGMKSSPLYLWHQRLAHVNYLTMKKLQLLGIVPCSSSNYDTDIITKCLVCTQAKHQQAYQRIPVSKTVKPFELIHSDLCGPIKTSIGGASYYILYIDDFTRYTSTYFLITKSAIEICEKFKHFKAWIEAQGFRIQ